MALTTRVANLNASLKERFKRVSSPVAQMVKNLPAVQQAQILSLGRKNPLEKDMASPLP